MATKEDCINAVKACGYELHRITEPDEEGSFTVIIRTSEGLETFDPLTDDGDCFRAMVDADMDVIYNSNPRFGKPYVQASTTGQYRVIVEYEADKHAATRQAVFDCLVAIGKEIGD